MPRELPSGAAPGSPRVLATGGTVWGIGDDALVLAVGEFRPGVLGGPPAVGLPEGDPQRVKVRGVDAEVFLVGDDGVGSIGISWLSGDCPYTLWLADGTTVVEAADYAVRF